MFRTKKLPSLFILMLFIKTSNFSRSIVSDCGLARKKNMKSRDDHFYLKQKYERVFIIIVRKKIENEKFNDNNDKRKSLIALFA
jgi:hypothetical protein